MTSPAATTSSASATRTPTHARNELAPIVDRLAAHFGEAHRARLASGIERVAERWNASDGDAAAMEAFCRQGFIVDPAQRTRFVDRLERALEDVHGHLYEMRRSLRWWSDVQVEDVKPLDDLLATFDPAPDLSEQLYRQKLAFVALLNLDRPDLATMLRDGASWTTRRWAEARIAQAFGPRVPSELNDLARRINHEAGQWVARFHVPVGGLVDERGGKVVGDPGRALLAHWLVREEIKANYGSQPGRGIADAPAVARQRALAWVMGRHIDGSIPRSVMDRTARGAWNAQANTVDGAPATDSVGPARYEHWLAQRAVAVKLDAHHPEHPTAMARKFELAREIPQDEVERLVTELLDAPVRRELAGLMRSRLGRPLEAFDIYYDDIADARPAAKFIGERITVQVSRGSGHAMRPNLPEYGAWLRTSRLEHELGWDGFETGMHELGHTVEQVVSCNFVPRAALRGVPNTACTEAFAFLYQSLAKRVLGLVDEAAEQRAFAVDSIQTLLAACQIAGPSLLELRVWRWLYENPDASPESLRAETLRIADELWERFFRRDFGADPYRLLAAYQHMINHPLYLADYTLGHIISHQIRSHLRGRDLATETRRICSIGRVTPDLWMRRAVGGPISVEAIVRDAAD
jgi:hypothetical protein